MSNPVPVNPVPSPTNEPVKEPVKCESATAELFVTLSSVALPVFKVDVPLSMFPKPLVIEPASNAPTVVTFDNVSNADSIVASVVESIWGILF